jgi:low affinity Fe/Cu permease
MMQLFSRFAHWTGEAMGTPLAFSLSLLVVVVWAMFGPVFNYSDTWQLIINTGTTVVTFWMIFLLQTTQNRDTKAMHKKLDELIRIHEEARNSLIGLEKKDEAIT